MKLNVGKILVILGECNVKLVNKILKKFKENFEEIIGHLKSGRISFFWTYFSSYSRIATADSENQNFLKKKEYIHRCNWQGFEWA